MFLDKFFQLFVAKEKKFFPLYTQQSQIISKAAELLLQLTRESDEAKRNTLAKEIKMLESDGDKVTHTLFDELYTTFVTPFDREDVHQLASQMDSFLDYIDDSAKKFSIYQPIGTDTKLIEIAEYINKDAQCIAETVQNLDKIRNKVDLLDKLCDRMKQIEHIVDDIYEDYMAYIFHNEKDPIELVKKKNIVQCLEDTTDYAKHVSETVRTIIVKMS